MKVDEQLATRMFIFARFTECFRKKNKVCNFKKINSQNAHFLKKNHKYTFIYGEGGNCIKIGKMQGEITRLQSMHKMCMNLRVGRI